MYRFDGWLKNLHWLSRALLIFSLLVLFGTFGCVDDDPVYRSASTTNIPTAESTKAESATTTNPPTTQPKEQASPIKLNKVKVTRVVDGDTIEVSLNGQKEKVRLIGVDTPETKHPSKPVEAYGKEASDYTTNKLDGRTVHLEVDVEARDRYGRLLAYVWLKAPSAINDSEIRAKMFNAHLLLDGYAQLATYPPNVKYVDYFTTYQREAREHNKGLWGAPAATTTTQKSVSPPAGAGGGGTVYITNTGEKYHVGGCRYLSKSKIPISLSDAKAKGYEACKVCRPPS